MMTRRNFTKTGMAMLAGAALRPPLCVGVEEAGNPRLTLPTPAQIAWQDCEIGLLYSFDLAIAAGDTTENNASRKTWDPNLYQPRKLDTDQWIEAAKACGARYAIFTATHFNGFMQWHEAGHAGYPCWATMPGGEGAVSHNAPGWQKFLGGGDPDGAVWSPGMVDVPLRGANKVHIAQFPAIEATAVRLVVDKSKAEPRLRYLEAHAGA